MLGKKVLCALQPVSAIAAIAKKNSDQQRDGEAVVAQHAVQPARRGGDAEPIARQAC